MRYLLITISSIALLYLPNGAVLSQSDSNKDSQEPGRVYSPKEVNRKLVIKSKPEAEYTREACKKGVVGAVLLQAVFAASGKVEQIKVLEELPEGLTESAIRAARKIKFEPAVKDGRAVSVQMKLHYNFNWNPLPKC